MNEDDVRTIVGPRYTISAMESGGQKQVFHVIDDQEHNEVLKIVKIEEFDEEEPDRVIPLTGEEERTTRELRLMASVSSPYLPTLGTVEMHEVTKDGLKYIVFSEIYIGNRTVKDLISAGFFDTPSKVKSLAHDIAQSLIVYSNFEDGFVHRDIKPSNIVYREANGEFVLIDGGIHLLPSSPTITSSHVFIGTQRYASPEQLTQGRRFMDSRSDIFSIGVVLYEAMTSMHPFYMRGQRADMGIDNHINAIFEPIPDTSNMNIFTPLLSRMITRHAHTRYTTPEDLLLDIEGVEV